MTAEFAQRAFRSHGSSLQSICRCWIPFCLFVLVLSLASAGSAFGQSTEATSSVSSVHERTPRCRPRLHPLQPHR